jgi:hypothetical protein
MAGIGAVLSSPCRGWWQREVRDPGAVVLAAREDHVARENRIRGASQIKLALRVGVSSNFDPADFTEYTRPKPPVADTESCGDYVTVRG